MCYTICIYLLFRRNTQSIFQFIVYYIANSLLPKNLNIFTIFFNGISCLNSNDFQYIFYESTQWSASEFLQSLSLRNTNINNKHIENFVKSGNWICSSIERTLTLVSWQMLIRAQLDPYTVAIIPLVYLTWQYNRLKRKCKLLMDAHDNWVYDTATEDHKPKCAIS